jgi:hypothetical protein
MKSAPIIGLVAAMGGAGCLGNVECEEYKVPKEYAEDLKGQEVVQKFCNDILAGKYFSDSSEPTPIGEAEYACTQGEFQVNVKMECEKPDGSKVMTNCDKFKRQVDVVFNEEVTCRANHDALD